MNRASSASIDVAEYGGKGASLVRLKESGYRVPSFTIIPASQFEQLADREGPLAAHTIATYFAQAERMQEWSDLFGEAALLAVRSSAVVEDSGTHSFAGQFRTELNVRLQHLPEAIARVWMSGYDESVVAYKSAGGFAKDHQMAVIIQLMVPADAAGVGFGIHPLSGDPNVVVINAVKGLGESLVSGAANADTYEIDSANKISISAVNGQAVLEEAQILEVAAITRKLGAEFGAPQDIEFAFAGGEFYLLQARPVTTRNAPTSDKATVWDNSNIVESYPGLTLPLTFSFIEKMYAAVYRQFTLVLGVSKRKVAAHNEVFESMLGLLNGRVYYNLNSWYAALALLPGYSVNARFMEGMMGVKEPPPVPVPESPKAGISDYWDIVRAVFAILLNLKNARASKRAFIRRFDKVYEQFNSKDFSAQPPSDTWEDYWEFQTLMTAGWKAPLVNDFFAMIYFGLLKKLTAKHLPTRPGGIL